MSGATLIELSGAPPPEINGALDTKRYDDLASRPR